MDFTEIYKQTSNLVSFSPGAQFLLTAIQDRLIVRRSDTFQIARTWAVDNSPSATSSILSFSKTKTTNASNTNVAQEGWISHIAWSRDSEYILAACAKRGVVNVFKLRDEAWDARIEAGTEGLVRAEWAPDARSIHFPLPTTSLHSIAISPNGNHLAVWEGPLEYKLHILSLVGNVLATFTPPEPDVALGLGIRAVAWHPSGGFIAVGGWDEKIYILTCHGWLPVATFELTSRIPSHVTVWKEPPDDRITPQAGSPLPLIRPDPNKPNAKSGLVQLEWNIDGTLLMARFEQSPTTIHIYHFPTPSQPFNPRARSVLIHTKPVLHARWNPTQAALLVACCGTGSIYTWDGRVEVGDVAECIGVPAKQFDVRDVRWSPDGRGITLLDRETFCCAFMVVEEDEDQEADETGELSAVQEQPDEEEA
ncbi:hypothetical protein FRB99_008852 [Tulasnella sp. 403]|nr:hypothetical protein FRB99_008852 [Tulasnella sp. 403]